MAGLGSKKRNNIVTGEDTKMVCNDQGLKIVRGVTRRDFLLYTVGAVAGSVLLSTMNTGCGNGVSHGLTGYSIDPPVVTTASRTLSFPYPVAGLSPVRLSSISQYGNYGYGNYTFGPGLPIVQRFDIMPSGYSNPSPVRLQQFANFFAFTDIHITDKETPNQLIYDQQADPVYGGP